MASSEVLLLTYRLRQSCTLRAFASHHAHEKACAHSQLMLCDSDCDQGDAEVQLMNFLFYLSVPVALHEQRYGLFPFFVALRV